MLPGFIRRLVLLLCLTPWGYLSPGRDYTSAVQQAVRIAELEKLTGNDALSSDSSMSAYWADFRRHMYEHRNDSLLHTLQDLAWAYHLRGSYDTSLALLRMAWYYQPVSGSRQTEIRTFYILASNYFARGAYERTVLYTYRALELTDSYLMNDHRLAGRVYNLAAHALVLTGQYEAAEKYLNQAIALSYAHGDSAFLALYYNNAGNIYGNAGDPKKAIRFFLRAYETARASGARRTRILAAGNLATMYSRERDADKAVAYGKEALELSREYDSPIESINAAYSLGGVYFNRGEYEEAVNCMLPAVDRARKIGLSDNLPDAFLTLAYSFRMMGRADRAFYYFDSYLAASDSAQKERFARLAHQMEARYASSEKDRMLASKHMEILSQKQQLRQRNLWIWGGLGGSLLVLLLLWSLYHNSRQQQKLAAERLGALQHKQEIIRLKAMMEGEEKERGRLAHELHDGIMVQFSAIKMNLSALPGRHPSLEHSEPFQKILGHLDQTTGELRRTAHHLMPDMLLRDGLMDALLYFCYNIQESTGLKIEIPRCEDLPRMLPEFELMTYRIIQELVHNVVKHASAEVLIVQVAIRERMLNLTVEDDGVGMQLPYREGIKGIGLTGIEARVRSMNGCMDVSGTPGEGTAVYIEMEIPEYGAVDDKAPTPGGAHRF